ncbi:hypothetical protein BDN72DRAFT_781253 [Pluteus cervinus]|uniref:Uncharacterized protein n=1 Tax=Pluteus cervinus TaxID=181527 RepID=A0ACD3A192_9AGAR|nr:hypothetical protein BDN72DRAFT_781253 [Pluteus cervinus]
MKECKTPDVPTFHRLRTVQGNLTRKLGISTTPHTSPLGNKFYMNHPTRLLALDWANPLVRPHIRTYPEVEGPVSEFWQADKWLEEIPYEQLSPMWADWKDPANRHRHFYVNELSSTEGGEYVLLLRWITVKGIVHVDVHEVEYNDAYQIFVVNTSSRRRIVASSLSRNVLDIEKRVGHDINLTLNVPSAHGKPNPLRLVADSRPMFRLRVVPWSDDVSGNVSKQYNAHTNVYLTNANLTHQAASQEYFVRFCSTSPTASSSEQFVALSEDFEKGIWHEAYDCELETMVLYQILPHLLPADNPQQSETSSHIGVKGNYLCRRDLTGGSEKEKEQPQLYHAMHKVGEPRKVSDTVEAIQQQYNLAVEGEPGLLQKHYSNSGIKDKISLFWIDQILSKGKEMRGRHLEDQRTRDPRLNDPGLIEKEREKLTARIEKEIQTELRKWVVSQPVGSLEKLAENDIMRQMLRPGDHYNALLDKDIIDVHKDTPVEILHTYLLGNDKYVWAEMHKKWSKDQSNLFALRLDSSSTDGLSKILLRPAYFVQYKNNLIGKHFRALQQLTVFHLDKICSPALFNLWKATGELGALIWFPEIRDMPQYLEDLQVLIDNLLDAWGVVDPRRIMTKAKLHILTHIVEDVRRFGPAILYATEVFECFNSVFRQCSVLSNHQAPSHDIAETMGDFERFKHIASLGWWKEGGGYTQAGTGIQEMVRSKKDIYQRLGWSLNSKHTPGFVQPLAKSNQQGKALSWAQAISPSHTIPQPNLPMAESPASWNRCQYVVSQSQDECREGSWVFFRDNERKTAIGCIFQLLSLANANASSISANTRVVIKVYEASSVKDHRLNMPALLPSVKPSQLTKPEDILFICNVQHDCYSGKCDLSEGQWIRRQERQAVKETGKRWTHTSLDRFVLNMHALHNVHLLREALPRSLTQPTPFHSDRKAVHTALSMDLQITGEKRRADIQAKTKATKERNKAAKAAAAAAELAAAEAGLADEELSADATMSSQLPAQTSSS